jgi:hypothetical protein
MEPSSTPFRRAGTLLTITALISLGISSSASARGFVGMGRVQAIHVVPRIPVGPQAVHRESAGRPVRMAPQNALLQHRPHRRFFRGAVFGFSDPYGYASPYPVPYPVDTGGPDYAAADAVDPGVLPFAPAACVRPLIIHIKPVAPAAHLPRVIYGRPPIC